ncbi:MAG: NACHT domain-containing protein [Actinobacteria bacterium]|nr:NACHT domain-containing protein [Actinomycetota bacterium]
MRVEPRDGGTRPPNSTAEPVQGARAQPFPPSLAVAFRTDVFAAGECEPLTLTNTSALRDRCHQMFALKVDRVCRVRAASDDELPMPVDGEGFLEPGGVLGSSAAAARAGDLLIPVAAAEAHALVMLGEPGLGKTTALRAIASHIDHHHAETLIWLDGSDLDVDTFDEEIGTFLRHLPPASDFESRTAVLPPRLTIVIDGLDESPMVHRLPHRLSNALDGRATSSLRLLIGCRTADLPPSLRQVLDSAFRPCLFVDLAPLRRIDAVALASSVGIDGQQLVDVAAEFGAGSLAAIPLTLQLLVRTYLEIGNLDQGARWLFAHGVEQLLAEDNPEHNRPSTLEQRTAIAERVAAVLVLSGRRTV